MLMADDFQGCLLALLCRGSCISRPAMVGRVAGKAAELEWARLEREKHILVKAVWMLGDGYSDENEHIRIKRRVRWA